MRVLMITTFLVGLLLGSAEAATRYAVPSGGAAGANCTDIGTPCTLARLVNQCVAGDTCYLRGGTYSVTANSLVTQAGTSWSSGEFLTFSRYQAEIVTLSRNPFAFGGSGNNMAYVLFHGITFDCQGCSGFVEGINISQGNGPLRFTSIEIKNAPGSGMQITDSAVGGNEIRDCHVHDNGDAIGHHGFYLFGTDNIIDNCDIHHNGQYGVHVYNSVRTAHRNIIRNNRIYSNNQVNVTAAGIILSSGDDNIAYNNSIYNCPGDCYGIQVDSNNPDGTLVYSNTIHGNGSTGLYIASNASNTVVRNNILNLNSAHIDDQGSVSVFSHNLCRTTGANCAHTGDPGFVSAAGGDFHIAAAGSPAVANPGTDLGAPYHVDQEGLARPNGSYTLGALQFGGTPPPPQPNPLGLIAEYVFNGTALDTSGRGHDGTLQGNATYGAGLIDAQALSLDGDGDYVSVAAHADFRSTTQWAIAGWLNMSATDTAGCVLASVGNAYGLWLYPDGRPSAWVVGSTYAEATGTSSVLTGTSRFIGATYEAGAGGSGLRVYVDGAQVAFNATVQAITYGGTEALRIGRFLDDTTYDCAGRLQRVRIYDTYLTATAMLNLYNEQVPQAGMALRHSRFTQAHAAEGVWMAALDANASVVLGSPFGLMWGITKSDAGSVTEFFRPECRVDTGSGFGSWTEVTNSFDTLGLRYLQDTVISTGQATSAACGATSIPCDGFTPAAGIFLENPIDTTAPYDAAQRASIASGQVVKVEPRFETGSPLVAGDVVECRPQRENATPFDSYATLPQLTILSIAPPTALVIGGTHQGGTLQ